MVSVFNPCVQFEYISVDLSNSEQPAKHADWKKTSFESLRQTGLNIFLLQILEW